MYVPIARPNLGREEEEAILRPLRSGMLVQGREVARFEGLFASICRSPFAVACSSGSAALALALSAIGVGPGDQVIVPSFTWISTANAALHLGAQVRFCDIDLRTMNTDASLIEPHLTQKTKAILPVHLFGGAVAMPELIELAQVQSQTKVREQPLFVVEDAACALGTSYRNQQVGTFGEIGIFSLHPRKAITTGEGGMMLTAHPWIRDLLCSLRNCGADLRPPNLPGYLMGDFSFLGMNARMTEMQGAFGQVQILKAETERERRRGLAERYKTELRDLDWLRLPEEIPESCHSYQSFVCIFAPEEPTLQNVEKLSEKRNELMGRLEEAGVQTRVGTLACHMTRLYREQNGVEPKDCPNAYLAYKLSIAIPLFGQMSDEEQEYVIDQLHRLAPK